MAAHSVPPKGQPKNMAPATEWPMSRYCGLSFALESASKAISAKTWCKVHRSTYRQDYEATKAMRNKDNGAFPDLATVSWRS